MLSPPCADSYSETGSNVQALRGQLEVLFVLFIDVLGLLIVHEFDKKKKIKKTSNNHSQASPMIF